MSALGNVPEAAPESLPPEDYMAEREITRLQESDKRERRRLSFFNYSILAIMVAVVICIIFALVTLVWYYFGPAGKAWISKDQIEHIESLTSQPAFGAIIGSAGTVLLGELRKLLPRSDSDNQTL